VKPEALSRHEGEFRLFTQADDGNCSQGSSGSGDSGGTDRYELGARNSVVFLFFCKDFLMAANKVLK